MRARPAVVQAPKNPRQQKPALQPAGLWQLALPGLALAQQLYVALEAQDGGGDGTQALLRVLERLNGTEVPAAGGAGGGAGA